MRGSVSSLDPYLAAFLGSVLGGLVPLVVLTLLVGRLFSSWPRLLAIPLTVFGALMATVTIRVAVWYARGANDDTLAQALVAYLVDAVLILLVMGYRSTNGHFLEARAQEQEGPRPRRKRRVRRKAREEGREDEP